MEDSNSKNLEYLLQTFVKIIGDKTSKKFVIETFDKVVGKLRSEYDFLRYVSIDDTAYSDNMPIVNVEHSSDLDNVDKGRVGKAVTDIFSNISRDILRDEIYFRIDLFDAVNVIRRSCRYLLEEYGIDINIALGIKGVEKKRDNVRVNEKEISEIKDRIVKNSEVLEPVLNVIVHLFKRHMREERAISIILSIVKKLERDYNFLKYVIVSPKSSHGNFDILEVRTEFEVDNIIFMKSEISYAVQATSKIDNVLDEKAASAFKEIIEECAKATGDLNISRTFITDFKSALGENGVSKLNEMGVPLDEMESRLWREGYEKLTFKTLEALFEILSESTSPKFALTSLDMLIEKLRDEYEDVFRYVSIDKSKYDDGVDAINVEPGINNLDSDRLVGAIKELIKKIQDNQADLSERMSFIERFKDQLGEIHTKELQNLGVNLFFIDMRFV